MVKLKPIALIAAAFLTWSAPTSRAGSQADALIQRTKVECLEAAANDPKYAGHSMAVRHCALADARGKLSRPQERGQRRY
jgi:hypothetical protein